MNNISSCVTCCTAQSTQEEMALKCSIANTLVQAPWNKILRARVGREQDILRMQHQGEVSIHAPAWGAVFWRL